MNRGIRNLLTHIVTRYAVVDEQRRIDLDANAEISGDDLQADKAAAAERERETAGDLADAFARGLNLAWTRAQQGEVAISLSDQDPDENAMADALIAYLVRFDLASSESRDLGDQHYAYDIAVDWDRLRDVVAESGVRFDAIFDSSPKGAA